MLKTIGHIRNVKTVLSIAHQAIEEADVLETLLSILITGKVREQYVASWVLSRAVELSPGILSESAHKTCLKAIIATNEGGIKRNLIRIWQYAIPESETMRIEIMDKALNLLSDSDQDVAVRAFSITVLEKLLKHFPEIKEEVLFILEREYSQAKPSFKVRADQFFKTASQL